VSADLVVAVGRRSHGVPPVNIESEGPYAPENLLPESIKILRQKIATIRSAAEQLLVEIEGEPAVEGDVEMAEA
jgi:DNA-directed RNA polymerase I and III subunit RPAC1